MTRRDFYTREACETGTTLRLPKPTGEDSGETLDVVGIDSARFRRAELDSRRTSLEAIEDKGSDYHKDKDAFAMRQRLIVLSKCVLRWSFDEPCTPEAVLELLEEAPYIADFLDKQIAKRALFLPTPSAAS